MSILTRTEAAAVDAAIDAVAAGWSAFARAAAEGRYADAERALEFTFALWEAIEPVDPSAGWSARAVFLLDAGDKR